MKATSAKIPELVQDAIDSIASGGGTNRNALTVAALRLVATDEEAKAAALELAAMTPQAGKAFDAEHLAGPPKPDPNQFLFDL